MRRLPWDVVLALLAGVGIGLVYAWMIAPLGVSDMDPSTLREDFKDRYRSAIAAAYAANGDLDRALARLELLQDPDPLDALNAQAQRMLARGEPAQDANQIAELAQALAEGPSGKDVPAAVAGTSTADGSIPVTDLTLILTETQVVPTATFTGGTPPAAQTPARPSGTSVPAQGAPFKITGQDETCDPNLPEGLLQLVVLDSGGRQLPGMEIAITWEDDAEQFFTGLKPEFGNGYADFIMVPDVSYTVQLAAGSDIATGLTAPTCQPSSGETFYGGIKLTFQQP